jgi:Fe-S cluster assembly protein SufB
MTNKYINQVVNKNYEYGFVTSIESDALPPGLSEDVVREISRRKNEPEFMLEWRLRAYRHWLTMTPPEWAHLHYPEIDFQSITPHQNQKSTAQKV